MARGGQDLRRGWKLETLQRKTTTCERVRLSVGSRQRCCCSLRFRCSTPAVGVLALCGGWIRDGDGSAVTLALQEASGSSSLASEAAQAPCSCRR